MPYFIVRILRAIWNIRRKCNTIFIVLPHKKTTFAKFCFEQYLKCGLKTFRITLTMKRNVYKCYPPPVAYPMSIIIHLIVWYIITFATIKSINQQVVAAVSSYFHSWGTHISTLSYSNVSIYKTLLLLCKSWKRACSIEKWQEWNMHSMMNHVQKDGKHSSSHSRNAISRTHIMITTA